jgi:hypothetical protein
VDNEAFDRFARVLGAAGSRRSMLGALLGVGAIAGGAGAGARGPRRRRNGRARAQALPGLRDCPNPRPGQNLSRCDFSGRDLRGVSLRGANLSGASFADANLCGADLRATNLANVDFRDANLTRVDLRGTNLSTATLDGAIFCQTRKPNGALDNSGCVAGAAVCCSAAECAAGEFCVDGACSPCPAGSVLLANGGCAATCETAADCAAAGCENFACSRAVSGPNLCDTSPVLTETCTSTAQCPLGTACTIASAPDSFACFTICTPSTN